MSVVPTRSHQIFENIRVLGFNTQTFEFVFIKNPTGAVPVGVLPIWARDVKFTDKFPTQQWVTSNFRSLGRHFQLQYSPVVFNRVKSILYVKVEDCSYSYFVNIFKGVPAPFNSKFKSCIPSVEVTSIRASRTISD